MDYEAAVAYLDDRIGLGVSPGLERVRGALDVMADPHFSYPVVHVAGTNGKGSTVRFVSAILSAHGLSVGSFVSPHLEVVEQRYALNNEPMTSGSFAALVTENAPLIELYEERAGQRLTYFELTAVLAFAWLADAAVDAAVVEVGLGGRLDATNVVVPAVSVITAIGLDHTEFLGDHLAAVAAEKAAIIKEEGTAVTGPLEEDASAVVAERVAAMTARWLALGREFRVERAVPAVGGWLVDLEGIYERYDDVLLASHGRHQVDNWAVAVATCEELTGRALEHRALARAATVTLPGRMEIVGTSPLVMLDGGHNPHGLAALDAALLQEFPTHRWTVVFGSTGSRDLAAMLETLRGRMTRLIAVTVDSPNGRPAADIAAAARRLGIEAHIAPDVAGALAMARDAAGVDGAVLITGSLYLVGAARLELAGGVAG